MHKAERTCTSVYAAQRVACAPNGRPLAAGHENESTAMAESARAIRAATRYPTGDTNQGRYIMSEIEG
jgi:hypothetical protein